MKWLAVLLIVPGLAWAASEDFVVKIKSVHSKALLQARLGSGVLISWNGHPYVLTSDHVVYHSNKSFAHEILNSQGQSLAVDYVVSDAGKGLALMEFKKEDSVPATLDLSVDSGEAMPNESLVLAGYPADSDTVLVDAQGRVGQLQRPSDIFVELLHLLEVRGGYGEFGMSGGGAFSPQGFFRGVLSHQIVEMATNRVLVISASVIRAWLKDVLDVDGGLRKPSPITLFQDPAQQVSDFPSLRTGNLYLSFSEPFADGSWALQPVLSKTVTTDTLFGGDSGPLANLQFKAKIPIQCFGFREAKVLGHGAGGASKLSLWLRRLKDPALEPLWTLDGDDTVKKVRAARAYYSKLRDFAGRIDARQAPGLAALTARLTELLQYTPSQNERDNSADEQGLGKWRLIKPKDLDFILQDPSLKSEWDFLAKEGLATRLRHNLVELRTIMADLTF